MAVKLHRCGTPWKFGPCWRVQKALDDQGIAYEVVAGPLRPKKRSAVIEAPASRSIPPSGSRTGAGTGKNRRTWRARSVRAG